MRHKASETIDGGQVFSDNYSKSWVMENFYYCPKCNPISLEDFLDK